MDAGPYSYAFQPIVDVEQKTIRAYEALVRGPVGEPACSVLNRYTGDALLRFDGHSRLTAVRIAAGLGLSCQLSLNILSRSLELNPAVLEETIDASEQHGIPASRLIFEVSETESIDDPQRFLQNIEPLRRAGVTFALDDFGAGYSGLNLLAEFQPDAIKLDLALIRDIHRKGARQAIVRGVLCTCGDLGIDVIAEGVEYIGEYDWLRSEGINLYQGYLFARPAFEELPSALFPR